MFQNKIFSKMEKNYPLFLSILLLQDLHKAMKMLGLNPMEQEVVDIPNQIARYTQLCIQIVESKKKPHNGLF